MLKKGLIKKQISNQYTIIDQETKKEYIGIASGKLRYVKVDEQDSFNIPYGRKTKTEQRRMQISPKVGDKILFDPNNEPITIEEVLPRQSDLIRPDVANVDQVLLLFSATNPNFSFNLLDKFLVILGQQNLKTVLVVSKIDLIEQDQLNKLKEILKYYENNIGIPVYYINSLNKDGLNKIKGIFENKITVLAGQTGVGKSTLLNALIPDINIKTQEISKALGRGKHTTRHSELYEYEKGFICDTPGFSKVSFEIYESEELKDLYPDFLKYSDDCKFSSCIHIHEPGCGVKKALEEGFILEERYNNYKLFYEEIEAKKNKY